MKLHDILTVGAALAAVIAMILLVRFGTRLTGLTQHGPPRQSALVLEASLALDARRRLTLVRCQGGRILLLTGGSSDMLLGWLPAMGAPPPEDAS